MPIIERGPVTLLSDVDSTISLGFGSWIWSFSVVGAHVRLGERVVIGSCCYVGRDSILGDDVHLNHGVFLPNGSRLGNRVFIGPNATFTDDKNPRANNPDYQAQPPIIEDDANIGAGAVILPGVRLGKGCTIGAGAVVTKDVPAGETWVGVPAKKLRKLPQPPADGGWFWRDPTKEKAEMPQGTKPKKPWKPRKPGRQR